MNLRSSNGDRQERDTPDPWRSSPRIAVIDDERALRQMLEIALRQRGFDVRSAADGFEGLQLVRSWNPEAIVLDVMMPTIDGITLLPQLRRLTEAPVLLLSARGELNARVNALVQGADDYLSKPFEVEELRARLIAALRRPMLDHPQVLRYAELALDLERRRVVRNGMEIELSTLEFDLLVALVRHADRVLSKEQLFTMVWGEASDSSLAVVERYISYLRAKVDDGFPHLLIRTVRGVGYVLRQGDSIWA